MVDSVSVGMPVSTLMVQMVRLNDTSSDEDTSNGSVIGRVSGTKVLCKEVATRH